MNVMDIVRKRDKIKHMMEYLRQEQGSQTGTVLLTDEEVEFVIDALREPLDWYEGFLTNIHIPKS